MDELVTFSVYRCNSMGRTSSGLRLPGETARNDLRYETDEPQSREAARKQGRAIEASTLIRPWEPLSGLSGPRFRAEEERVALALTTVASRDLPRITKNHRGNQR